MGMGMGMDHSAHDMSAMMDHMMSPYLFGNMKPFHLLFREAKIRNGGHLAAAIIVSCIFTMLVTLFSFYGKRIEMMSAMSTKRISGIKVAATAIFAVRMFFHYIAMLLVMSMNIWILLAVTLGHALGYLVYYVIFPSKKKDKDGDTDADINVNSNSGDATAAEALSA